MAVSLDFFLMGQSRFRRGRRVQCWRIGKCWKPLGLGFPGLRRHKQKCKHGSV